jgi:hypothetical protein
LRRTEVAVNGKVSTWAARLRVGAEQLLQLLRHLYSASHHHDVNVVSGTFEEYVANVSAYEVAFHAHPVSRFAYFMEYVFVEYFCQFGITI